MVDGPEWNQKVREKMEAAHGFHELGMHDDAWVVLDDMPPVQVRAVNGRSLMDSSSKP
jgi:peptidoglycan/xylan/chitin deacetylase (PgdA/CDA1 family)